MVAPLTDAPAPPTATPLRRRGSRGRLRTLTRRDQIVATVMVGIPLLLDLAFVWLPAVGSVFLSFTKWTGVGSIKLRSCADFPSAPGIPQPGCLNGVQNYRQAFTNYPDFWPAVRHNAIWLLVFMVIATPLGMLFAVIIDRGIRGSRIYQSLLFLPVMLSLALIGIIWELIYAPNLGLINTVIERNTNDNLIDWLGNPHLNLWALLVEATWRQAGYVMVLYLAGLKAVDPSLREAATIDGASEWQSFWRVIFATMRPINIVVLVVTVIESLRAFDLVYITSNGNPLRGLELLSVAVTQNIVGETQRIGFGSTLGVVLLVISLVPITIFLYQAFRREEPR
ncbi:MAG: multiple sugar transport system permease protein [Actinoplanes sp.]|jgi:ABC-type sugar transport system permease subunit|nr:multiple sugar transport system permease protein [Actinoplanes sp.]